MSRTAIDTGPFVKLMKAFLPGFQERPGSVHTQLRDFALWQANLGQSQRLIVPEIVWVEARLALKRPEEQQLLR